MSTNFFDLNQLPEIDLDLLLAKLFFVEETPLETCEIILRHFQQQEEPWALNEVLNSVIIMMEEDVGNQWDFDLASSSFNDFKRHREEFEEMVDKLELFRAAGIVPEATWELVATTRARYSPRKDSLKPYDG